MNRLSLIAIAFVSLVACATGGQGTGDADMSEAEAIALYNATAKWEDQIVCKKTRITGTSIKRNVCRTRSEIEDELQNSRDAMDIINREQGYKRY